MLCTNMTWWCTSVAFFRKYLPPLSYRTFVFLIGIISLNELSMEPTGEIAVFLGGIS